MGILYILFVQLNSLTQSSNLGAVNIDWSNILDPIGELIFGNDEGLEGIIGENEMVAGLFLFMILFLLTLIMGLGMLVGSVVIIPSLFAVFQYVPSLQMLVGIICGLLFGFGLNKIVRR